jgi:outer membrane immunogenic protein
MTKLIARNLLSGVSFAALSCSAFAADMAVKAPPLAPIPTYSWTGFYGGLHAGVGFPADPNATATMGVGLCVVQCTPPPPQQTFNLKSEVFPFGGVQVGYDWQFQPQWVVGLEADFSGSSHTRGGAQFVAGPFIGGSITDNVTSTQGIDWFGTVRGRVGYLVFPSLLAYGTGGLVYGHTRNDFTQVITGPGIGTPSTFNVVSGTRDISTGWTAGGGFEWALDRKWSVKLEYDYLQFNDAVASSSTFLFFTPLLKSHFVGAFNVQSGNNSAHTVQIGLNYHFWD